MQKRKSERENERKATEKRKRESERAREREREKIILPALDLIEMLLGDRDAKNQKYTFINIQIVKL